jgi:hypothetical protein
MKDADLKRHVQNTCKSVCTSTIVLVPDPLYPTQSTTETPENKEKEPNDPEPADEGDIQTDCYSH